MANLVGPAPPAALPLSTLQCSQRGDEAICREVGELFLLSRSRSLSRRKVPLSHPSRLPMQKGSLGSNPETQRHLNALASHLKPIAYPVRSKSVVVVCCLLFVPSFSPRGKLKNGHNRVNGPRHLADLLVVRSYSRERARSRFCCIRMPPLVVPPSLYMTTFLWSPRLPCCHFISMVVAVVADRPPPAPAPLLSCLRPRFDPSSPPYPALQRNIQHPQRAAPPPQTSSPSRTASRRSNRSSKTTGPFAPARWMRGPGRRERRRRAESLMRIGRTGILWRCWARGRVRVEGGEQVKQEEGGKVAPVAGG